MADYSEMKAQREMSLMERLEAVEEKLRAETDERDGEAGKLRQRVSRLERTIFGDEPKEEVER